MTAKDRDEWIFRLSAVADMLAAVNATVTNTARSELLALLRKLKAERDAEGMR